MKTTSDMPARKVALITGAGRACGRAIAEDFARRGATVVLNDIDRRAGEETLARITSSGGDASFVAADVSSEPAVGAMIDEILDRYGRLNAAVNSAGIEELGLVTESDAASFARLFATNLEGVRACMKHEIRALRSSGGGAIVNLSSVTSDLTAAPKNGLYAATKGGVDALTKSAAVEVAGEGISINAIAFIAADVEDGMFQRYLKDTDTPQEQILALIPIRRLLSARELAAAAWYLCSEDARFVVGTTMVLDGGFTAV